MERKVNSKLLAKYFPQKEREKNNVLMDDFVAWSSLEEFKKQFVRNKEYTLEDQWNNLTP